jgi:RHS repeat-associated protein
MTGTERAGVPAAAPPNTAVNPGESDNARAGDRREPTPRLPSPTLPKGGGAIRGMGETYTVNPASGTASFALPLALSRGRADSTPPLQLTYHTGAGNSAFGLGFAVEVPSVVRRTDHGLPRYDTELDTFLLAGDELVPQVPAGPSNVDIDGVLHRAWRYRPRVERAFARIELCVPPAGGTPFWRTFSPDNVVSFYGRRPEARVADPADPTRVFEWLLEETRDDRGNVVAYEYQQEDLAGVDPAVIHERHRIGGPQPAGRYLKSVRYGNRTPGTVQPSCFLVVFDYGEHDDVTPTPTRTRPWPVRADPFSTYRAGFERRTWRLCRRVLMFHDFAELGDGPLPRLVGSTDLSYVEDPVATKLVAVTQTGYRWTGAGYERASLPPIEFAYTSAGPDNRVRSIDAPGGAPVSGEAYWVDLDGEGLPGALTRHADGWWYRRNLGEGKLGAAVLVREQPSLGTGDEPLRLLDVDGAGQVALVELGPHRVGYTQHDEAGGWGPFVPFRQVPVLDFADSRLRHVDLDGDGLADLLFPAGESIRWHRSLGREGFGPAEWVLQGADEQRGPVLLQADATQAVMLADMSGDGLADLVRVRNGEVSYWPNLGYGRFGARVTMSKPPLFDHIGQFEPGRVRLADVDGSGPGDLLYLGRDSVRYWRNQAGNGFGPADELRPFPAPDPLADIEVSDLLGTGTACLVWSTPASRDDADRLRYLDLARANGPDADPNNPAQAGVKPHLLCRIVNNRGAETRIGYAPSTRHYLNAAGGATPWTTRLPFPVHVIDAVEHIDHVSETHLRTDYHYWDGYFDGVEREFRGFGLVETVDAESVAQAPGETLDLPPVRTRSWFHLGMYPEPPAHGRYSGDPLAPPLPPGEVVGAASGTDERAARRALAGLVLRTEVYADDGAPTAQHPYSVVETRYRAVRRQPASGRRSAVFSAHARETVTYHYERNPADPRVAHEVVLQVDEYGAVRRSVSVGYRRRKPAVPEQATTLLTETLVDVAHRVTATVHRLRVPVAIRVYEATGLADLAGGPRFTAEELAGALAAQSTIAVRRLVEHARIGYWSDNLGTELAAGEVGDRALVRRTYRAAFASELLTDIFGTAVDAALLSAEGGYGFADGLWWMPSAVTRYDPEMFFQAVAADDPFGNLASVTYDSYGLLVTAARAAQQAPYDALLTTVDNDYRLLTPRQITDPNGARSSVSFDALGLVTATWQVGRDGEGDPPALPGTVFTYDAEAWRTARRPLWAQVDRRERHGAADGPWLRSRVYSDGSGRVAMTKVQAEPGLAWTVDALGQPVQVDTGATARWVGTGRTVFNNKGLPVAQYEPYFSAAPDFEDDDRLVKQGVTVLLRYDPLGRLVHTAHPDGTVHRIEFDPWRQVDWDGTDTVLASTWYAERGKPDPQAEPEPAEPERRAAWLAARHAGTPTVSIMDSLGRVVRAVADNGVDGRYETRVELDVEGQPLAVIDPRGIVVQRHRYDLAGRVLRSDSADTGVRRMLPDVAGQPIRSWDARGSVIRLRYDLLRRPTQSWVLDPGAAAERLATLTLYGELHPEALQRNLRGRVWRRYEDAGLAETEWVDFKGNAQVVTRRLGEFDGRSDWVALATVPVDRLDTVGVGPPLGEGFTETTEHDALGRPTAQTLPDGTVLLTRFNEAGLLDGVSARLRGTTEATWFVTNVDYNAKGQREWIEYQNGVRTRYTHDPLTYRLRRLETWHGNDRLRDLAYTYDAVGNIVQVTDGAQQTVFFAGQVVAATTRYRYDAVYRLVEAQGREHASIGAQPDYRDPQRVGIPHPNDGSALRRYTETYGYDESGNLRRMAHVAGTTGSWTRRCLYATDSNQLLAHSIPGDPDDVHSATLGYDPHGCVGALSLPRLPTLDWDEHDRLSMVDLGGGGSAVYRYDAGGQRVRKVVTRSNGVVEERIYLGAFELFRRYRNGSPVFERQTVHVGDGTALVETTVLNADSAVLDTTPRQRYQLTNHLGSSILEVDEAGAVISYEEYHPYGTTSVWLAEGATEVSVKRYRYTGKEKDDETGLYYHGARYYLCWLGRWLSPDPIGISDGPNVYAYVHGNPIGHADPTGTQTIKDVGERPPGVPQDWHMWAKMPGGKVVVVRDPEEFQRRAKDLVIYRYSAELAKKNLKEALQAIKGAAEEAPRGEKFGPPSDGGAGPKKPERTWFQKLVQDVGILGGILQGGTEEDVARGETGGGVGGMNPNASRSTSLSAAVAVLNIGSAVLPSDRASEFMRLLARATKNKLKNFVVRDLTAHTARELMRNPYLAKQLAPRLSRMGVIARYDALKEVTKGLGGKYHAHHILEKRTLKVLGMPEDAAPAVILRGSKHLGDLHPALAREVENFEVDQLSKKELFEAYEKVYKKVGHPEWAEVIRPYFFK